MSYFEDRKIVIARNRFGNHFESQRKIYPGIIASFNGSTVFSQLGDNWTWVKVWSRPESLVPMLNPTSLSEEGTRVLCARDPRPPNRWRILSVDDSYSSETSQVPWNQFNTGIHGSSHQILDETDPGPDPILVGTPMMYPLKTVGDGATLTVSTYPYNYTQNGAPRTFSGFDTDLTSYIPVAASKIRSVLIYLNRDTGILGLVAGTIVADDGVTPIPDPPPPTDVNAEISCWIYLSTGQSTITTSTDIRDRRDFLGNSDNALPVPSEVGQVLMYVDGGVQWVTPLIGEDGTWLTNEAGELLYV